MTQQPHRAVVGTDQPRVDGRLKVTGKARYAADHGPAEGVDGIVHAVLVESSIGRGRITGIDTRAAENLPGVLRVIHHGNAPRLPYRDNPFPDSINPPGERLRAFQDDLVRFFGEPVGVVVATTLEVARHAARLVEVTYDVELPVVDLSRAPADEPETYARGDADTAWEAAEVHLEMTYRMSRNHHNAMEPHAIIARWQGERLTVWDKTQWVADPRNELAAVFGIPREAVRCLSPFVGGAFGNGGRTWVHSAIAALAAREVRRPVKLVLTRRQQYFTAGFRPGYEYTMRVGSDRRGRITAMVHDVRGESSRYERHSDDLSIGRMLYAIPHVRQAVRHVPLDISTPTWMRGPGWSSAAYTIESALDELAHELEIDPIELRMRNEPTQDPATGQPFSTRRLRECYDVGAREFGWHRRNPTPGVARDGDWLIGMGMAAGAYMTERAAAQAHVRLDANGTAVVQSATSDIGPGTHTSMTQVAADALGLPMGAVEFRLGDTALPPAPIQALAWTMASVGSAVQDACDRLRRRAIALAVDDERSPLHGVDPDDVAVERGRMHARDDPSRGETYRQLLARNNRPFLGLTGSYNPEESRFSMYAYSAIFAEVAVDARLGLVRVRRMLGVFDAGRIINPRLADSQALGGMIGGISQALLEHTVTDHRDGRIVNANLADYLVPVNADIPDMRAIYVDSVDDKADPIGVKGLGEIVIVGVAPAVANAVFNATGRRIRDLPITPEALLGL
ncbi:xanthine dehydrogenase family protein molybdopterin-binding subunit [Phytoactinopolyspora halotolerans]|uniref:Xanthine dehydrogenase family protein molybdopterin-binding subunit n=1 Tax=Phytoactinopolyspora halotolerans TaxID=1981512 RepID=A0A6L9SE55_9ACTN|nr:xanthine dehydrogenase family protein molybdopterin-binding subunit [Phytoactinopolyspora halotolerans]NEE03566.1 xanthine dehydrogenase family protein molybdopterin-binding subunit [Phytoactinopolyspora halotolerans]